MTYEAHLGPYRGRDPRLATASRGVVANPMEHVESSKIPLATIADFLADPGGYDPEESWARAIADVVGGAAGADPDGDDVAADVAAFATYADNVRLSCLEPSDSPVLVRLLEDLAFVTAVDDAKGRSRVAAEVVATGRRLRDAVTRITRPGFANPGLAAEQAPWLRVAALGAEAMVAMGEVLGDPASDQDAIVAALAPHLTILRDQRHRVFGDVLEMTLNDLVSDPVPTGRNQLEEGTP